MRVLDLFSGIGGFSLGLERAGMTTMAFCEIDPFCRRVLAKHWPGVPVYEDVRDVTAARLGADGIDVDVICGGFPCQDISIAGKGAGLAGERSGLWREYARIVGELGPRYVIVENVAALLYRGLGDVLRDLAALGYDAEWHCIPASAVGAPHRRDRVWIVAHADGGRSSGRNAVAGNGGEVSSQGAQRFVCGSGGGADVAHSVSERSAAGTASRVGESRVPHELGDGASQARGWAQLKSWAGWHGDVADAECGQRPLGRPAGRVGRLIESVQRLGDWPIAHQPVLCRGTDGVPARLDRLRSLGNAVVPQIPELIGRAILRAEAA